MTNSRELAFIDSGLSDIPVLLRGLRPDVEAIVLDAHQPAPAQIAAELERRPRPAAVHVLAHGRPGEISFTGGVLSRTTLPDHARDVARIGRALDGGGFNLWSCRTAQGDAGRDFTEALADAAGGPVAAATQLVGAAALGGQWTLGSRVGDADVTVPLTAAGIEAYGAVLDTKTWVGIGPGPIPVPLSWEDPNNWDPVGVPQDGDDVIVDQASSFASIEADTAILASLVMRTPVVIAGFKLEVSGAGITLDGAGALLGGSGTIAANITGTGMVGASMGVLTLSGIVDGPTLAIDTPTPSTLKITGTATTPSAIVIDNANQTLEVAVGGSLTIGASESITNGTIELTGGTLIGAGGLAIGSGATLTGFGTVAANIAAGTGTITAAGGPLVLSGTVASGNTFTIDDASISTLKFTGIATVAAAIEIDSANQTLEVGAGGNLTIEATQSITDGKIVLSGGTLTDAAGLTIGSGATLTGFGTVTTDVTADGGTITVTGPTLSIGGTVFNDGTVVVDTSTLAAAATLSGTVFDNDVGALSDGGTLSIVGVGSRQATVTLTSAAGLGADGVISGEVELIGNALLEFGSGTINTIDESGSLWLDSAQAHVTAADAAPDAPENSALTGLATNAGYLQLSNGASVETLSVDLENTGGIALDVLDGEGGSALDIGGTLANTGMVVVGNATLSDSTTLTADAIEQNCGCGSLLIVGGDTEQAAVRIASEAGFGEVGTLFGIVALSGNALLEFGSGSITTIDFNGYLVLDGDQTRFNVATDGADNSALKGLAVNEGGLELGNGAWVTTDGDLLNDDSGGVFVDGYNGGGGSRLDIGGKLTNVGLLYVGNETITDAVTLTADSIDNDCGCGELSIVGGDTEQATVAIASNAGFGTDGSLTGYVELIGNALLSFTGGTINTIELDSVLSLDGAQARVAVTGALDSNSALTGLTDNAGLLDLTDGAEVAITGSFSSTGYLQVDGSPTLFESGGSTLTIGGTLTNSGMVALGNGSIGSTTTISAGSVDNSAAGMIEITGSDDGQAILEAGSLDNSGSISVDAGGVLDIAGDLGMAGDSTLTVESDGTLTTGALTTVLKTGDGTTSTIDLQGRSFESQYRIVVESGTLEFVGTAGTATPELTGAGIIQGEVSLDGGTNVLTITPTGLAGPGGSLTYHFYHTDLALAYTDVLASNGDRTITGSDLGEILTGGAGNDKIYGGTGADTLNGLGGNDKLYGSDDADKLYGGTGFDQLFGGEGNDRLNGGTLADVMTGGTGNDVYFVDNAGDQVIEAVGEGTDTVYAKVDYTLAAGEEIERLRADIGAMDLTLTGNEFGNELTGSAGDDKLYGLSGVDKLYGGEGNDRLNGGTWADVMSGGIGNDVYFVDNAGDQVIEAAGEGTDTVYAKVDYTLAAGEEIENLRADVGAMDLTLTGNEFRNELRGSAGDDRLYGGRGVDRLYGGEGNDRLNGGTWADVMAGGIGNDVYFVDNAGDQVIEAANEGNDTVYAKVDYTLAAGQEIENLRTDVGAPGLRLTGNELRNSLRGGAGADELNGGGGSDTLSGGASNDWLEGGTGADIFLFDTQFIGVTNIDTVADFEVGIDTIRLDHTYFAGLALGQLRDSAFAIDSPTGTDPQIVYNSSTGALSYDSNGTGSGGASSFATITGIPPLTAHSFVVV